MLLFFTLFVFFSFLDSSHAEIELSDSAKVRKALGVENYGFTPKLKKMKVVVVDKGFQGFQPRMPSLPESTTLISEIKDYPADFLKELNEDEKKVRLSSEETDHGLRVAEVYKSVLGDAGNGLQLFLVTAGKATAFEIAARFATFIEADIVIHSQNFDFSNADGRGVYNRAVNSFCKAREKSFWVNASGNDAGLIYRGKIEFKEPRKQKGEVVLVGERAEFLEFTVNQNNLLVEALLTWNSFDEKEEGTEQDLNLYILNEKNETVKAVVKEKLIESKSEKRQVLLKNVKTNDELDLPVEKVSMPLPKGKYRIYVMANSNNFLLGDELTLTLKPQSKKSEIFNAERGRNVPVLEFNKPSVFSILKSPADNKFAITVGSLSPVTSLGPTSDGRPKPEIFMPEIPLVTDDGDILVGSSFSTPLFAGVLTFLKAYDDDFDRERLMAYVNTLELPSQLSSLARIEEVKAEDFEKVFPGFLRFINSKLEASGSKPVVLIGKYPDGQYVMGLEVFPSQLKNWFEKVPADGNDKYEYYLGVKEKPIGRFARNREKDGSVERQPYPWEEDRRNNNSLRRTDYIELRKAVRSSALEEKRKEEAKKIGRVWKSPEGK